MRSYGKIESTFWQNPKVRNLSEDGRLLLLYIYTTQHGNSIGCFTLPIGYISEDLNWASERVREHITELVSKGFIERSETNNLIRIVGWFGHNTIENLNVAKAAVKTLKTLPDCDIKHRAINELNSLGNKFVNTLRNELPNEYRNPEPEPEPDPEPETTQPEIPEKPRELRDDFFEKCFSFITERFPMLTPCNSAPIHAWQKAGYDFETQIKPTIESAAAKAVKPKSFNYFTSILEGIGDKKIIAAPKPERKLSAEEIERNRQWKKSMGIETYA